MNIENIKSQMRKGVLEYCILLILKNKEAYASDIIRILQEIDLIVVEGTLYPMLTYQWVESTQGPPRKYYTITEEGNKFLLELERAWGELNQTLETLKNSWNNESL